MKLFLCGGGSGLKIKKSLEKFSKLIDKDKPILYIPFAMESIDYDNCYDWFSKEIKYMKLNKFEMVKSSFELSKKELTDYGAIFIGGGNTYKLLSNLKEYDNFKKIKTYLEKDGVIFAGSAGAIIFGNNIDSCLLTDENKVGLTDTKGFDYLNGVSLLCHLNKENFQKNRKYLEEYSEKNRLIYLKEETVIFINNNKISLIGNPEYIYFQDGKYAIHNFANLKRDILEK